MLQHLPLEDIFCSTKGPTFFFQVENGSETLSRNCLKFYMLMIDKSKKITQKADFFFFELGSVDKPIN